jgi:hypothetical protein
MFEKIENMILKAGETLIDKIKKLDSQEEIGKCFRTIVVGVTAGYTVNTICKNGGINFGNKLFVATSPASSGKRS